MSDYFEIAKDINRVYMAGMDASKSKWEDFIFAPKTGMEILVYYPLQSVYALVSYNKLHSYWESKGRPLLGIENQGVKWMALPKPFEAGQEK